MPTDRARQLAQQLEQEGIVVVPDLFTAEQLRGMQRVFAARLRRLRWNNADGFEKTELYRHMVQDVLTLHQGFVDVALHPLVKETLGLYLGANFELVEAKGWESLPTRRDFHGWHGDAWYHQGQVRDIPREVKLAFYLTDVSSGAFTYIKGSHGRQAPRPVRQDEVLDVPADRVVSITGPAGSAFLFDTSGIHRQAVPILEARQAVFYNYHDPRVPLQDEDVAYYRYHPLLLNAAFLGGLGDLDQKILGFGNKTNYIEGFERAGAHPHFRTLLGRAFDVRLRAGDLWQRVSGRLRRIFRRRKN